jgi:hypothetical protein
MGNGSGHKAWVVTVDMGYGHQRAAYPFKDIAEERIITANSDKTVTEEERKRWEKVRMLYESVSRFKSIPLIGESLWRIYDRAQTISPYYPFRDLSKPSFGAIYLDEQLKKGFIKSIIEYVKKKDLPFISTFFATAIAASHYGLKRVYCVVTDTDINRAWVPKDPKTHSITYLAPTEDTAKRLEEYGVPPERICFTGFPLPKENIGEHLSILNSDLSCRLGLLDPDRQFIPKYKEIIQKNIGRIKNKDRPLTLMFSVGGAGAQQEIADKIILGLKNKIHMHRIKLILMSGTRPEVEQHFVKTAVLAGLKDELGGFLQVICKLDKKSYFAEFNSLLRETDILWTKPSELSFYTALGLPIIISPPVGYHEIMNRKWLVTMGSGMDQEDPEFCGEWLFDLLKKGLLAKMAWQGYMLAPKYGTYNIERMLKGSSQKLRY